MFVLLFCPEIVQLGRRPAATPDRQGTGTGTGTEPESVLALRGWTKQYAMRIHAARLRAWE